VHNEAHKALTALSEAELRKLILELGFYALSVSRKLSWRTGNGVELPEGETCDSIVSLALVKVLTGQRRWDPQKAPELKKYLMDVIDSLLNHLATGKDNRVLTTIPAARGDAAGDVTSRWRPGPTATAWQAQPARSPEALLLQKEETQHEDRVLQLLLEASHNDPVVTQIIRAMQDGHEKSGEIAAVLGIPVREVYAAMKRLSRKMVQVRTRAQEILA
jgi:DNA-directed RNA polymerase specialized sigma24 family protein